MNTWGSLKPEAWKILKKLTWHNLKFDNLKKLLVYKYIAYNELNEQYCCSEIGIDYAYRELVS